MASLASRLSRLFSAIARATADYRYAARRMRELRSHVTDLPPTRCTPRQHLSDDDPRRGDAPGSTQDWS